MVKTDMSAAWVIMLPDCNMVPQPNWVTVQTLDLIQNTVGLQHLDVHSIRTLYVIL